MMIPPPPRWMYFPPVQIFGRILVQVYYTTAGSSIPLSEAARALHLPARTARRVLESNRAVIPLTDVRTGEVIAPDQPLSSDPQVVGLTMAGISLLILALEPDRLPDPQDRERIILAKQWLLAQVSNRIKSPGRKNQPRWDHGLTVEQAASFKKEFSKLRPK